MFGYMAAGIVCAGLVVITVLLLTGRGANLVAGFNTLPKEEKEKFDKTALSKFVGKILIPIELAAFTAIWGGVAGMSWSAWAGIALGILIFPYIIGVTVYMNTGNRFRK